MASNNCVCKRSELPIYTSSTSTPQETCPQPPTLIETGVRSLRLQFVKGYEQLEDLKSKGEDLVLTGVARSEEIINFLQQEDNTVPRYGAIAVGGLAGLILAMRGGIIRKALSTTLGAGAVASVCYPNEARHYSQIGIQEAKKYAAIAYNFAYGVKKGEPVRELPSLPKLPSSLSEAWDIASSFGKSSNEPTVSGDFLGKGDKQEVKE